MFPVLAPITVSTPEFESANEQMPSQAELSIRTEYIKGLVHVAICSAAGPCPICQQDYDKEHSPILLKGCGHIFGKTCILEWFNEGANTCPLDRETLFASCMNSEDDDDDDDNSSLVPFDYNQDSRVDFGLDAGRQVGRVRRVRLTSAHYHCLYFGGEIIGVNGRLTSPGCRRVVCDLWYHVNALIQRISVHPDELCLLSVREDDVIGLIEDALPRGVNVEGDEQIWSLLSSIARAMLSLQENAWSEGRESRIQGEDVERWSASLWEVCGGYDEDGN